MFISQVTFESEKSNENTLQYIMKKKVKEAAGAKGAISAECWKSEVQESVSYTLVVKWETKGHFKTWLSESHAEGHKKREDSKDRPKIQKTAFQYELVDINSL